MLLVQALVTALLSGLFSGAIMFALNERRDRSNVTLNKIESTVEVYALWTETLDSWLFKHYDLFLSDQRETARYEIARLLKDVNAARLKAKMLQEIYLPDESSALDSVLLIASNFAHTSRDLQISALNGEPLEKSGSDQISATALALVDAAHNGQQQLYAAARRHSQAPFLVAMPKFRLNFWKPS